MQSEQAFQNQNSFAMRLADFGANIPRRAAVGVILVVALLSFEIFNFDTTRYALNSLLGDVSFINLGWASILALAFCSIDFAGLVRLFTPEKGLDEPKEVWYLMGAWLLGATMNAVMTWWAVSLTLLNHDFGNEVLSREELLTYVPIFVAVLVWLTRILFIGAFSVAGEHIFDFAGEKERPQPTARRQPQPRPSVSHPSRPRPVRRQPVRRPAPQAANAQTKEVPEFLDNYPTVVNPALVNEKQPTYPKRQQSSRIRQRPPMPRNGVRRTPYKNGGVQAKSRGS